MKTLSRSILSGTASGAVTFGASILALAYTNAFAMPRGFPMLVWEAVVVFGIGATLVALLIHFLAIRMSSARTLPALLAFATTVVVAMAVSGLLAHGGKAICAWLVGALLASLAYRWRRPDGAAGPFPLRDPA